MSKLTNKYEHFKKMYRAAGVSGSRKEPLLYFDALCMRFILRTNLEEYIHNSYYSYRFPARKALRDYCALIETRRSRWSVILDFLLCRFLMTVRADEYFRNAFYDLKWSGRQDFMTIGKKQKMMKICNSRAEVPCIDDKVKFNRNFSRFVNRDWIDLAGCREDELEAFAQKHPQCFCKYSDGLQGIGARKIDFQAVSVEELYRADHGKKIILEELIEQHEAMASINKTTVNTIRVVTLVCADDTVKIVGAALRMGRADQVADNFHLHGIAANIDLDTGIVNSMGVDAMFRRYTVHPDSKMAIPGFRIPHWDAVIAEVKKAAAVYPSVRYVGWDIAIRKDDICFVEGNSTACPDVLEMPAREGIWKKIKEDVRTISGRKAS